MTIKIVVRGTRPEDVVYVCNCSNCNSRLEYNKTDVRSTNDQRDPGYILKCPLCNYDIWITKLTKKVVDD